MKRGSNTDYGGHSQHLKRSPQHFPNPCFIRGERAFHLVARRENDKLPAQRQLTTPASTMTCELAGFSESFRDDGGFPNFKCKRPRNPGGERDAARSGDTLTIPAFHGRCGRSRPDCEISRKMTSNYAAMRCGIWRIDVLIPLAAARNSWKICMSSAEAVSSSGCHCTPRQNQSSSIDS